MWLLLVSDDLAVLITHSKIRESVLMVLVFLRVMGFPLSWKKLAGGEVLRWVGYELVLRNSALGLSASPAMARGLVHETPPCQVCADARVSGRVRSSGVRLRSSGLRPALPGTSVYICVQTRAQQCETSSTVRSGHSGISTKEDITEKTLRVRTIQNELESSLARGRTRRRRRSWSRRVVAADQRQRPGKGPGTHLGLQ